MAVDVDLRDIEQIRKLVAVYNFAFDARDEAGFTSCWTEDGFAERHGSELQHRGHAQLAALVRDFPVNGRHLTTDLIIDVDGDSATLRSYMLYLDMGPPCEISMFGVYNDELVRVDGVWKFRRRSFVPHSIRSSEVAPGFMEAVAASTRA